VTGPVVLKGPLDAGRYHATASGLVVPGRTNHPKTQRFLDSLGKHSPETCPACDALAAVHHPTGVLLGWVGGTLPAWKMTPRGMVTFRTPCPVCHGRAFV
jgi:hypothetical protein